MTNTFLELSKIDTSELKEKKGRFDYLSWAVALRELLKKYPKATFKVHEYNDSPYMDTALGFFVKVSVSVEGVEHTQIHPILDNRNMPITKPNAFQVNTSIQRCLAKAIALHGLGLSLFAGEDLADLSVMKDKENSFTYTELSNEETELVVTQAKRLQKMTEEEIKESKHKYPPKPASEKQKGLLNTLNVEFKENITSKEASQLIEKNINKPPAKSPPENTEDDAIYYDLKKTIEGSTAPESLFVEIMKGMIEDCPESRRTELRLVGRLKLDKIRREHTA